MQRGSKRSHDDANANALPLRTGQWTQAEIAFAQKVIQYFHLGTLPNCENGATLRALLAELLHCSPMRISKKFAGDGAIGKRTFTRVEALEERSRTELQTMELAFHESIEGNARWPLVPWATLLLGRAGGGGDGPGPARDAPPRGDVGAGAAGAAGPGGLTQNPITLRRLAYDRGAPGGEERPSGPPEMYGSLYNRSLLHREVYGWVPNELGVDKSPHTLARLLDVSGQTMSDRAAHIAALSEPRTSPPNSLGAPSPAQSHRSLESGSTGGASPRQDAHHSGGTSPAYLSPLDAHRALAGDAAQRSPAFTYGPPVVRGDRAGSDLSAASSQRSAATQLLPAFAPPPPGRPGEFEAPGLYPNLPPGASPLDLQRLLQPGMGYSPSPQQQHRFLVQSYQNAQQAAFGRAWAAGAPPPAAGDAARAVPAISYDDGSSTGSVSRALASIGEPSPVPSDRPLPGMAAPPPRPPAPDAKADDAASDGSSPASITPSSVADSLSPADMSRVMTGGAAPPPAPAAAAATAPPPAPQA